MTGYVYFARFDPGFVKIGYSADPVRRVGSLATSGNTIFPAEVNRASGRLVKVIPGNRETERGLHERFSSHRDVGEFFVDCDPLSSFIESLACADVKAGRFTVALPADLHGRLRTISDKTGISLARLLKDAVVAYLRRASRKENA